MPNYTPTFNLVKPVGPELFNVSHANENADKLDAAVMKKDGSNSNLAYLNFTNGSQLIVDTDKNILNMVFPDGTTANIPSELWFSEGKYTGTIAEGDNVMFAGSQGDYYLLKKAVASELAANPHLYAGVATKAGVLNDWGKVTRWGLVNNINTNGFAYGTRLYFDPVTLGFTSTLPSVLNARIEVGMVIKQGIANGILLVNPYILQSYTKAEVDAQVALLAPKANPTFTGTQTLPNIVTNGIKFPATQIPSADPNTLDDYEEGTWTPTINTTTKTYTIQYGNYTKIGNLVTVSFNLVFSNTTSGTGDLEIGGLPFAVSNKNSNLRASGAISYNNIGSSTYSLYTQSGLGYFLITTGSAFLNRSAIGVSAIVIIGTITYETN